MSEEDVGQNEPVSYAETSAFTRLLRVPSRVKIIDVFLGKHYTNLSRSDIAKLAGVDPSTVGRNIDEIVEYGIIEEAESNGRASLYQLNKNSRIAQILGRARDELGRESDKIPRASERTDHLMLSGQPSIQDSLRNYTLDRRHDSSERGPRPSEHIDVEGTSTKSLGIES